MNRIFKLYEKNTECLRTRVSPDYSSKHKLKLTPKTLLIIVAMVFLAALVGCTAAYFISQNFRGDVNNEFTNIFLVNTENCPTIIEERYYFSEIPEGYELYEDESTPFDSCISYKNMSTGHIISLSQSVKNGYGTHHLNTEHYKLEEVEINGNSGLCIDYSDAIQARVLILWDNGDYILEITADMNKNEVVDLAKSTKVLEN